MSVAGVPTLVAGPYFDDLAPGDVDEGAPAVTLTDGLAAVHAAITGSRLRLPLDVELSRRVIGAERPLAHPALVWDVAIGQSTQFTQRVIANLFYRRLVFRRLPLIGDTLRTTTEVVALKQNRSRRQGRATGLALLRIKTVDQAGRPVLEVTRCAMLPLREDRDTGHADPVAEDPPGFHPDELRAPVAGWRLEEMAPQEGPLIDELRAGMSWELVGGDAVTADPELARMTLNVAMTHLDHRASMASGRLVYGGHTIGIAAAQLTRALPNLAAIVAWERCDHLAPVFEGDVLTSTVKLERCDPLPGGGGLLHLRSRVKAWRARPSGDEAVEVLDWRLVGAHP